MKAIADLPPIPIDYIEDYIRVSKLCKEDISVLNELIRCWQADCSIGSMIMEIMKAKRESTTKNKMITINLLDGIPNSEKMFAIAGSDLGLKQRKHHKIDEIENNNDKIEIKISDNIMFLSSSFFLGMFGESVRKCGTKEKFREKFIFKMNKLLEQNIEDGIREALIK